MSPSYHPQHRQGSNVAIRTTTTNTSPKEERRRRRKAHLTALLPATVTMDSNSENGIRVIKPTFIWYSMGTLMAFRDLTTILLLHDQEREENNQTTTTTTKQQKQQIPLLAANPSVRERLKDCDIDFSLEMIDTQYNELITARRFLDVIARGETIHRRHRRTSTNISSATAVELESEDEEPLIVPPLLPIGVIGAGRPETSAMLSHIATPYDIPFIAPNSLIPTTNNNEGDCKAMIRYLQDINVTDVAVLYPAKHNEFFADISKFGSMVNIGVASYRYENTWTSINQTVDQLKSSGLRYIVSILEADGKIYKAAVDAGIFGGPGYAWLGMSKIDIFDLGYRMNRTTEGWLANAIDSSGFFVMNLPLNPTFEEALKEYHESGELQASFLDHHTEPELFADFDFSTAISGPDLYRHYDALMAMAIAACECEQDLFTGTELHEQLLNTSFNGTSGRVEFDPLTGTRRYEDIQYSMENVFVSEERSTEDMIGFEAPTSAIINLRKDTVEHKRKFVYSDGTTNQPPSRPPIGKMDMNLIPTWMQAFGLSLCGLVMIMSVGWFAWSIFHRKDCVVRASQPIFLCQLCVGTILSASAIIPMALQEPVSQQILDASCMLQMWLLVMGYATSLSALFSKSWRLNQIFLSGQRLRRIQVKAFDVILPFCVLMIVNVTLLTAWTIVAPLTWKRVPGDSYDSFGRSIDSYGTCSAPSTGLFTAFAVPILGVNLLAVVIASYQIYRSRKICAELSEARYIAVAFASIVETSLIAVPVLIVTSLQPGSFFFVKALVVSVSCLAILLPIFIPKYLRRRELLASGSARPVPVRRVSGLETHDTSQTPNTVTSRPPPGEARRYGVYVINRQPGFMRSGSSCDYSSAQFNASETFKIKRRGSATRV